MRIILIISILFIVTYSLLAREKLDSKDDTLNNNNTDIFQITEQQRLNILWLMNIRDTRWCYADKISVSFWDHGVLSDVHFYHRSHRGNFVRAISSNMGLYRFDFPEQNSVTYRGFVLRNQKLHVLRTKIPYYSQLNNDEQLRDQFYHETNIDQDNFGNHKSIFSKISSSDF
ncbi:MAG: hypothetical protein ACRCV0_05990 [Brevinema sp.]